jgi:tetratricopeptide (TPR) repeat protein
VAEPDEIRQGRAALGVQLAAWRTAAGLSQRALSAELAYSRSTIANVEVGRQSAPREFWRRCDELLTAGGELLAAYDELTALVRRGAEARARRLNQAAARGSTGPTEGDTLEYELDAQVRRPLASTVDQVEELLTHLREQWHLLVRTDNLFGPRFALGGVLLQLQLLHELLTSARAAARVEFVKQAAQYAESAAWLYEDGGDLSTAQAYNDRAMAWAQEAGDDQMVVWTMFRRSQQAAYRGDAAQVIGLCQAARRNDRVLTAPMRAAIAQQQAHGYALDGDEASTQRLLDESHRWAATDAAGDARQGHGSFCTDSYIELQRAACYLRLGQPRDAVRLYEAALPTLPRVYRRDRGVGLSRCAIAHLAVGQPEQAATVALEALQIAVDVGSQRTLRQVQAVGRRLTPHRSLEPVGRLLAELALVTAS